MTANNMRQLRVMIDREGEYGSDASQWPSAADKQLGLLDDLGLGFILGSRTDYQYLKSPAQRQSERMVAAQAVAEAARDRRLPACETCECAKCVDARTLPQVLRILEAAERRKS